jgi:hypothetical protein
MTFLREGHRVTSNFFGFAFLFTGVALAFFLLRSLFAKGQRRRALKFAALSLLLTIGSIIGFGFATDQEARDAGFLGTTDRRQAIEAGYPDPLAWAPIREGRRAALLEEADALAVQVAQRDEALAEVIDLVTKSTQGLPTIFRAHGNKITEDARMQPLAPDALGYARFLWVVDSIENLCRYLGQRSNVEILDPANGIQSWIATAEADPNHPDHAEYLTILGQLSDAVSNLGEDVVCPAMYALLGPGGTLMNDALAINGLIDPMELHRHEVRVEDGVLWSSRDYCERRYYLQNGGQESLHEAACEEAEVQGL